MHTVNAPAVTFVNMVDSGIKQRGFGQCRKSMLELIAVSVGLSNAEMLIPILCDPYQVFFGGLGKPIIRHVSIGGVVWLLAISHLQCDH
jgi:hypothetical protein